MSGVPDSTRVLSARLEPDGTILLQLVFPGRAEPVAAAIEPIETTARAAGPVPRAVQLAYGHPEDRLLRLLVAMHGDALAHEWQQRAAACTPDAEASRR